MVAWLSKLKRKIPNPQKVGNSRIVRLFYWLVIIFLTCLILSIGFLPSSINLEVGEIAPEDVYYEGDTTQYVSDLATDQAKAEAALAVKEVYRLDETVFQNLSADVVNIFSSVINVKATKELETDADRIRFLQNNLGIKLSQATLEIGLNTTASNLLIWQELMIDLLNDNLKNGVTSDHLNKTVENISLSISKQSVSSNCKDFLFAVLKVLDIRPNMVYDLAATNEAKEQAMAAVSPISVTVKQGEKILSKGSDVTATQLEKLQKLGLSSNKEQVLPRLGLLLFSIGLFALFISYLKAFFPKISKQVSNIILMGFLLILFLLLAKLFFLLQSSTQTGIVPVIGYLVPTAAFSMLFAILFNSQIAVWATIIMGLFLSVVGRGQLIYVLLGFISGFTGIYKVAKVSQRSELMGAGLYIALVNTVVLASWGLMWQQTYEEMAANVFAGVINGFLCSVITIGMLPFFESAFRVITVIRLLELANSNNPLLKQLMTEAPGTYYHSVLVGNLAEAAADAIKANSLLVRVASYFHDIGKIKRPTFFIENQKDENPHDRLQPTLSTLIITSHVKDGVEILKAHKFPQEIMDIVEQHHGTSLLTFFYNKAKSLEGNSVSKKNFCYPGPKPQTREAAIVMLADSVQAAVQSLENPSKGIVGGKVREIIKGKFDSGQLLECDLTFRDLNMIGQAFSHVLAGVQHSRIVYPMLPDKQAKRSKNETIDEQQVENLSWTGDENGFLSGSVDDTPGDGSGNESAATSGDQSAHYE